MNDATRRATRTLLQSLPGAFIVTGWNLFAPPDLRLNGEQAAWLIALLTALSSFVQNTIEAQVGEAILKTPLEKAISKSEKDGGA
jgi:hypothetical protein